MSDWQAALRNADRIACDIETYDNDTLACFGFAVSAEEAYVVPGQNLDIIKEICRNPIPKIWANGRYDLYFLKYISDIVVRGEVHDVQLAWFACYPELAGAEEDEDKNKFTRKSLAFLASLFTYDEWWKGVYETEDEFFVYNGKDCAITYDIMQHLDDLMDQMQVRSVYDHVRRLVWPCVDMLHRGLYVDEELRQDRVRALSERVETLREKLNGLARPLIERESEKIETRLFEHVEGVCECCRHAKNKQRQCWSCAGFESAPSKADLIEKFGNPDDLLKDELAAKTLSTCEVCEGKEREEWIEWNPNSDDQNKIVLYDMLKLPKRYNGGSLTTDEESLKGILGIVST